MSEIFSHFIQHFDRYFILSRQSVLIIQWSAVCLAVLYALTFHPKISRERVWFYSGILLRAVLLAGITVELVHQVQSTYFSAHYLISEERELLPIVHLLMYGYVLLTAFHYMLMPREQRGKGMFYTFDLTVVALPVIQLIFSFFTFWNISPDAMAGEDIVSMLCFITVVLLLLISMNVLFFKMYWKPRPVFIGVFYVGVIGLLVWVLAAPSAGVTKDYGRLLPFTVYLTMAGFLMTHHLFDRSDRIRQRTKSFLAAATAAGFIVFLNPVYNAGDAAFAVSKPIAEDSVDNVGEHITSDQAERILTSFFPAENPIYLTETNQDLHYFYRFKTEDYEAEVDEVSQLITNYQYFKKPKGRTFTEEEYRKKSLDFLSAHGRKIKTQGIQTTVRKENGQFVVEIAPKTQGTKHEDSGTVFYWEKDTIMGFSEDPSIYQLESLPQVHMTEKDIVKASKAAFRTLQMPDQTFEITNTDINSLIGSSLTVTANNGTELIFDAVSGRLMKIRVSPDSTVLTKTELQKKLFSLLDADTSKLRQIDKSEGNLVFENSEGTFVYMLRNEEGMKEASFYGQVSAKTFPHTYRDGQTAFKKVAAAYNGIIYKKRVKPVIAVKDGVTYNAWLVIIQPFGSNRHDAYVVNADTYEAVNPYEQ
ncbi:hypothetical protein [Bacillus velezensis]|uniref:hypothetical protein n=1 Tax=Bacillus velezensis TaxID=492670 RepID=UPI002E1E3DD5|nr:hypothetical protein [Bacillus velezensis]